MEPRNPFGFAQPSATRAGAFDMGLRAYMLGIYNYMASALALTGIVALGATQIPAVMHALYVYDTDGVLLGVSSLSKLVTISWFILGMVLTFGIQRLKMGTVKTLFWTYAVLTGLTFFSIFLAYTGASIARAFFITAGMFGGMSLYGYTTKRDLTGIGAFCVMACFGLILASLVNLFLHSTSLYWAVSVAFVFVFLGFTAHNTQTSKNIYYQVAGNAEAAARASIYGAFGLYLDFINLFLLLVRLIGDRR